MISSVVPLVCLVGMSFYEYINVAFGLNAHIGVETQSRFWDLSLV